MTVYEADWICPATSAPIRDGAMAVEHGRIVKVGARNDVQGTERVRYPGCAIIPGFVNTHTHLELTIFHGLLDDLGFGDWIAKLVRIKYGALSPDALQLSARLGAIQMLQAGITAVGEVMDVGTGWEAMQEFGLQGIAYQEVFGPAEAMAAESLRGLETKVQGYRRQETETQRIGISPHAPYTVSKTLYERARDFARSERLPMTAHIAESHEETLFVRDGTGHFADAHRKREIAVTPRHLLPIAYLDSLGLLGPDMLLVHAVETADRDLQRIRDTGTFIAHCPRSNTKLRHGVARVADMRKLGIPVSLGTDSTASNDSIDMFAEMRLAMAQQGLTADDGFRMATIDGAHALGLGKYLGSLEPKKRADFAVIEMKGSTSDPIQEMLASSNRSHVRATFLAGHEADLDDSKVREEIELIRRDLARQGSVS
jgi:cytosine/adenosine deaminase-related metal-dependent hydrolase